MNENQQIAYKDLQVWQKSMDLATSIIEIVAELNTNRKHFRLIEQLESSATSIPMNIAEGKGRDSKKEYVRFLYIARGSIYETLTLLEIFLRQGWISKETYTELERNSLEIIRMLKGLINSISKSMHNK
jgi:four helix bundle protein